MVPLDQPSHHRPPPTNADASAVLRGIEATNRKLLNYFNAILPTLTYCDSDDRHWHFSDVVMNGYTFQFNLCNDGGSRIPASSRQVLSYEINPSSLILAVNLNHITICDDELRMEVTPDMLDRVEGGYMLWVEGSE